MSSTSHFQIMPDFYMSKEDCINSHKIKHNTNPRYRYFCQTHFTAGDFDQFNQYRDLYNPEYGLKNDVKISENNIFKEVEILKLNWEKYENLNALDIVNTFNYIFYKFKKGIFVKTTNNKITVFLPFSNKNFINEWSHLIQIDPCKYKTFNNLFEKVSKFEGRRFFPNSINKYIDRWYANNSLFRYEFPIYEGDTNNPVYSDMFKTLANEREIPDIEFFLNRRDYPILKNDSTEAYESIFGKNYKLVSHDYAKYCPIFSSVTSENFQDIPIPTGEDWARVSRLQGKYFQKTENRQYIIKNIVEWKNRKPIAIFRGSSTGSGTTIETNMRLKLAYLSKTNKKDDDGFPFLDAGITDWNLRPRKNNKYIDTIDIDKIGINLVEKMSPEKQTEFKYVINIDGHVCAFRLSLELELGFCILLVQSKYKLWYSDMLQPYIHYVPIKEDLSDIYEKIKWCKNNDKKCKQISENAKNFAKIKLSREGILDYLQKVFVETKKKIGNYKYLKYDLKVIFTEKQKQILHDKIEITKQMIKSDLSFVPHIKHEFYRSFGFLKSIEWLFHVKTNIQDCSKNLVFTNKSSKVYKICIDDYDIICKESNKDLTHQSFVGIMCINELCRDIPNFMYTFGLNHGKLYTEYIAGSTLYDWIIQSFNIDEYIFILLQITLALYMAYIKYGFIHWDLTPWNIIIQKTERKVSFDYTIQNTIYRVKTNLIPVIIDFDKSHVIYDSIHFGGSKFFKVSTIQDILTILSTSLSEICNLERITEDTKQKIIKLANFLSDTSYINRPFYLCGKDGLGGIRYFFTQAKKYCNIVDQDKGDLENKTHVLFIEYLMNFKNQDINKVDNIKYHMDNYDPRFIFNYFQTSNKIESFSFLLENMQKDHISERDNIDQYYYTVKNFMYIKTMYKYLKKILKSNKNGENKKEKKVLLLLYRKFIRSMFTDVKNKLQNLDVQNNIIFPNYNNYYKLDESVFLQNKILHPFTESEIIKSHDSDLHKFQYICKVEDFSCEITKSIPYYDIFNLNHISKANKKTFNFIIGKNK